MNKVTYSHGESNIATAMGISPEREKELDEAGEKAFNELQAKRKESGRISTTMIMEAVCIAAETETELTYCAFNAGRIVEYNTKQRPSLLDLLSSELGVEE